MMKNKILTVFTLCVLLTSLINAQHIPNNEFNYWSGSQPLYWDT